MMWFAFDAYAADQQFDPAGIMVGLAELETMLRQ